MELRELINKSHNLRSELKKLQIQTDSIHTQLDDLDKIIKTRLDEMGEEYENLTEEEFQLLMADHSDPKKLSIEVVYADQQVQIIKAIELPAGATIEDGIKISGILEKCADIDLAHNKTGIFGQIKPLTAVLNDGDRVEIYRPVTAKA